MKMNEDTSVEDILRFAVQEEQVAADLYQKLAKQADNFETKKVFEQLARDEMRHKVILSKIIEDANVVLRQEFLPSEFQRQSEDKINAPEQSGMSGIIKATIQKELEAATMYLELANSCQDSETSHLLNILAEEELKHKKGLELEYEFYSI